MNMNKRIFPLSLLTTVVLAVFIATPTWAADVTLTFTTLTEYTPAGGPLRAGDKIIVKNATGGDMKVSIINGDGTVLADKVLVANNGEIARTITVVGNARVCIFPANVLRPSIAQGQCVDLTSFAVPVPALGELGLIALVAAWHLLQHEIEYQDLGPDHFDHLNRDRLARYHQRRRARFQGHADHF